MRQTPFWIQGEQRVHPILRGRRSADAVVVGGGFTGLTTALWLCKAGLRVVLLEADTLGSGASGACAGIVSLSDGLLYDRLERGLGQEVAAAYAQTQLNAFQSLKDMAREPDAQSGWRDEDVYLVASGRDEAALVREAEAMRRAGVAAEAVKPTQSPMPAECALRLQGMATLQPAKHLRHLVRQAEALELEIFEHSRVVALETNLASTERGSVLAPYVVIATGYPIVNTPGWYFLRLIQKRSYLVPLEGSAQFDGAYMDARGAYSLRRLKDGMLLQMNGSRLGDGAYDPAQRFTTDYAPFLGAHDAEQFYAGAECYSADGLPYVGAYSKKTPNLFIGTGYGGRGLLGGMVTAQAVSAKILGLPYDGYSVYSGQRKGGVIRSDECKTAAGIGGRYLKGAFRFGSPRCPHMGCRLVYRPKARIWECPCHGSCFDDIGNVLNAPAVHDAVIQRRRRG